ncbi:MAG: serine/threonine protein kinase, partial [Ignavibacteriales bacterium]|nr:serine/threonine protein kinase [Ignavibacteriales bacterium]
MIGQVVSHYKILEKLGEGGMGVVYKAQDLKLNRTVALKFLPGELRTSQEEIKRFHQEASALSALNHPNIATIYDIDEADGKRFIALEYLPGGTVKSKLKDLHSGGRELPLAQVVEYGVQIAEALSHAHKRNIVHRDVKTDNLLLTEDRKVKITDFGLAKLRGDVEITKTGSTVGTPAYMSPEQIRGEEIDQRSDIFSFGIVLYELTTGRLAFRGEHEAALTYSIVNDDPISIGTLRPTIPAEWERLILKCLEKNKNQRYGSCDQIVADLRSVQQVISGYVPTQKPRQGSKGRVLWGAIAAIVTLA